MRGGSLELVQDECASVDLSAEGYRDNRPRTDNPYSLFCISSYSLVPKYKIVCPAQRNRYHNGIHCRSVYTQDGYYNLAHPESWYSCYYGYSHHFPAGAEEGAGEDGTQQLVHVYF